MAQARKKTDTVVSLNVLRHLRYALQETGFLLCAGVALYLFIALWSFHPQDPAWTHTGRSAEIHNLAGVTGAYFSNISFYFFGYGAYLLPLSVGFAGWRFFKGGGFAALDPEIVFFRSLGFIVAVAAGCGLLFSYFGGGQEYYSPGGIIGELVARHMYTAFGAFGSGLFLLTLFLAGVNLATGVPWLVIIDGIGKLVLYIANLLVQCAWSVWLRIGKMFALLGSALQRQPKRLQSRVKRSPAQEPTFDAAPLEDPPESDRFMLNEELEPAAEAVPPVLIKEAVVKQTTLPLPAPDNNDEDVVPAPKKRQPKAGDAALPPLDLLDIVPSDQPGYSAESLTEMARQVETVLGDFGIQVQVVGVEPGPVIIRFELEPAPGVKVSQISNLAKDLARGLSVVSVRVVEVIPGKSVIGLEIPNRHRATVYLSEILDSAAYTKSASPLTLGLGKDIGGSPVVTNLAKMPHLLVAGTTGAGKSVALNSMLLSFLYKARADEVRLILIDPKMLELSIYEGIPHLLAPVVTDMKEAANALRWCVGEMERRYQLMAALRVRNITGFNHQVSEAIAGGQPLPDPLYDPAKAVSADAPAPTLEPLPYIVVVIDELADLMMIVGKKVEEFIARLAQKARASGIHLILATQRPSVDVITGLIKANIPTRIAFQVSSKTDSRTILDQMGAEQLLGHGDMLYLPPGTGLPQRVHGAFVDDHEVIQVVEFLKQTGQPEYMDEILQEQNDSDGWSNSAGAAAGSDDYGGGDPLYDEAVRIVTESRRASISGVQRRLKIGYNRAARLIEEMESAGIVGPLESNGAREVLAPPPPEV